MLEKIFPLDKINEPCTQVQLGGLTHKPTRKWLLSNDSHKIALSYYLNDFETPAREIEKQVLLPALSIPKLRNSK
jgi:hypothetical protein